eukprot:4857884-Prymnesium_polylepis.1
MSARVSSDDTRASAYLLSPTKGAKSPIAAARTSYADLTATLIGPEAAREQNPPPGRNEFHAESNALRARLFEMNRGLIHPNSRQMSYWDVVTMLALVFTAFVTPFEIALIRETKVDALFAINQIVNVVFLIDIVINFFVMYRRESMQGGQARAGATLP